MKRSPLLVGVLAAFSLATLHAADPATPAPTQAAAEKPGKPMRPGKMERPHDGHGGWGAPQGMNRGPRGGFRDKQGAPGGATCETGACPMAGDMLQLTDEQKKKVKEAMKAAEPKIAAIRAEEQAKIAEVIAAAVRPVLDEKQQAVFDDLQKLRQDKLQLKAAAPADTKKAE